MQQAFPPRTLYSLQSLRGIFALFIFFHHLGLFEAGGDAGVSFFIMLSGFVLSAGYGRKIGTEVFRYPDFIRKRFRRIYPYHIIGFIMALVTMSPFYGNRTPLIWTLNLSMLQSWIPSPTFYFSCDSPSWCLSDLFFCYALFPVLTRVVRCRGIVMTAIPVLIIGYFLLLPFIPDQLIAGIIYINPLLRLIDFILGMLLWEIFFNPASTFSTSFINHGLRGKSISAVELSSLVIFAACIAIYPVIPESIRLASLWWVPSGIIIMVFAGTENNRGIIGRFLSWRYAVRFGDLSFAFYMLHVPVINGYRRILHHLPESTVQNYCLETDSAVGVLTIFTITLILSILTERLLRFR